MFEHTHARARRPQLTRRRKSDWLVTTCPLSHESTDFPGDLCGCVRTWWTPPTSNTRSYGLGELGVLAGYLSLMKSIACWVGGASGRSAMQIPGTRDVTRLDPRRLMAGPASPHAPHASPISPSRTRRSAGSIGSHIESHIYDTALRIGHGCLLHCQKAKSRPFRQAI